MIPTTPLRQQLHRRERTVGGWIQIGHPAVAEIFADAGFPWLVIDTEHTEISDEGIAALVRALGRWPATVPLVRVRENAAMAIRIPLDLGAAGVIVPLVESAADARRAVEAVKYPPLGRRGFAFCPANEHGAAFDDYVRQANDRTVVVAMVETRRGVEAVDEILAVDGIDAILVGPYDLSGSFGVPGQVEHPLVVAATARVCAACAAAGRSAGLHVVTPDARRIAQATDLGFTFLAVGMDTVFLRTAAAGVLNLTRASDPGGERERR